MKKLKFLALALTLLGCTPSPEPIDFGTDACAHCKMTIVDKPFAAELVTSKSKVYKFDAIECMVQFLGTGQAKQPALLLVRDYTNPDTWIDATKATYLVSQAIPSPMGGYLSAYTNAETASRLQGEKGGQLLDWNALLEKYGVPH